MNLNIKIAYIVILLGYFIRMFELGDDKNITLLYYFIFAYKCHLSEHCFYFQSIQKHFGIFIIIWNYFHTMITDINLVACHLIKDCCFIWLMLFLVFIFVGFPFLFGLRLIYVSFYISV